MEELPIFAVVIKPSAMEFKKMKTTLFLLVALMMPLLSAFGQNHLPEDFKERYTLKQVVVLSRHNIRSPLSGRQSALQRITPHEWHHWSSAPSELSLRGGVLETMMGQYFRKWFVSEGLMRENEIPTEGAMRFYANSMQRTIATTQYFTSGMLPVANVRIEHLRELGKMDPVFTPQITDDNEGFKKLAKQQITAMGGDKGIVGIGEKLAENYRLLEQALDLELSPACREGDTCHFRTDDVQVHLVKNREPAIGGSLRLACQAADALVLQYYEEPDALKAAFGDTLSVEDWGRISEIKDWYGDVLFIAPSVARQAANPLLRTMLTELENDMRRFTFLCGHDSNISSVLAALEVEDYSLPYTIEKKTPIGCKLVIEKWEDHEGQTFAALNLVYQSTEQMRNLSLLNLENPPMVYPIRLKGLSANEDGLYPFQALVQRFIEACLFAEGYAPLPYRIYRSDKAESMTGALPLVVFLHGAGERGNDNGAQLTHCINYFLDDTVTEQYPFLLLVPQCPAGKRWVNTDWSLPEHQMESEPTEELLGVIHLVDSLILCGAVDPSRVYLCGISMGGFGVWDALQRWPDKFAAAIPICGGGDPSYAKLMKDTPVFIFHGLQDNIVKPSRSIEMYYALKTAGSEEALLVTYPDLAHGCWDEAFSTQGLFHWLFSKCMKR